MIRSKFVSSVACIFASSALRIQMLSIIDTARRAMVTLLKSLAGIYCVAVLLTRQSTDVEVSAAFKKVARKAHPDKGGAPEHQKALNAARDAWQDAVRAGKNCGGALGPSSALSEPRTLPRPTFATSSRSAGRLSRRTEQCPDSEVSEPVIAACLQLHSPGAPQQKQMHRHVQPSLR